MNSIRTISFFGFFLAILTISCQDTANFFETDYSDVPALADTTSALSRTVTMNGITIYVIEEGDSESFSVTIRDNINAFFTVYNDVTDQIVQSTYANGVTSAQRIANVGNQGAIQLVGNQLFPGISGMQSGERRVLVYPDSLTERDFPVIIDFELQEVIY